MEIADVLTAVPYLGEFFPAVLIRAANIEFINTVNVQHLLFDIMFTWFSSPFLHWKISHITKKYTKIMVFVRGNKISNPRARSSVRRVRALNAYH